MNENERIAIAESANMIVGGYAFSLTEDNFIRIVDLHAPFHALVINKNGEVLETNMDDIEIVKGNGDTVVKEQGVLTDKELRIIREFVKDNYQDMFLVWSKMSNQGFYGE